ncbi:MAG TPA: LLM class flavin-dependent oxidoreductase [Trebonia sp.]
MRVALMIPPDYPLAGVPALAAGAEDAGFDLIACGEHLFFHGPVPNAFVALAAAAGATTRIRLLSALTILPLYPAAVAAKLVATLDGVSGGRFELGVGVGGEYPAEFAAAGVPVAERGRRTDEALEVLARLLPGQPASFGGAYTTLGGQRLQPPAVQQPRPPVWVGGRREASMRRAARYADGWLPYLITPERLASGMDTVRAEAALSGRAPGAVRAGVYCWAATDADGHWARRTAAATVSAIYQQDLRPQAGQYLLAGTPAEVSARIAEYAAAGAQTLVYAPACERDDLARVVRTFAEDVLPGLRERTDGGNTGG